MKFYVRSEGEANLFQITEKDYTLTSHKLIDRMEPRELDLTIARNVPVAQFSEVIAAEAWKVLFRGYVDTYDIDSKRTKTLTCMGAEGWLNRRSSVSYFYPLGTTFSVLFSDTCADSAVPGLIAIANSSVPPGLDYSVYASDDNEIKIAGGGKTGRFGTRSLYSVDYRYLNQIDEITDLSDMSVLDNAFYRDDDDIYIKLNNHKQRGWADLGGLLVENAFDTGVRLGDVTGTGLAGELQTTQEDKLGDMIVDIAIGHGKYVQISDDWSHTYINIGDTEGRETGYSLYEKDMLDIQKTTPSDSKVHCISGVGVGNQYYSYGDLSHTGLWNQDSYEVEHGFKDASGILKQHVEDKYTLQQTDWQWKVTMPMKDKKAILLNPGDFLRIYPYHEPSEYLSCQTIEYTPGQVLIELGARRPRYIDSWEVLQGVEGCYTDRYIRAAHESITQTCSFYPNDPTHATAAAGSMTFAVPAKVLDTDINPRITLQLSLNISSDKTLTLGRVAITLAVDGDYVPFGYITATTIGDAGAGIPEIDITDYATADADNVVTLNVYMVEDFVETHSAYTGHPAISASATMNFYRRGSTA